MLQEGNVGLNSAMLWWIVTACPSWYLRIRCFTLKDHPYLFLSLVPTVPQTAHLWGLPQPCCIASSDAFQKARQIHALKNQGIQAVTFLPSAFQFLTKNCLSAAWFSHGSSVGESGFKRSDAAWRQRYVLFRTKTQVAVVGIWRHPEGYTVGIGCDHF